MTFQRFSQNDFDQYLPNATQHLGNEITKARDLTKAEGFELAKTSFSSLFAGGNVDSKDQHIGHLIANGSEIGVMHFGIKRDQGKPYIYLWDIEVFPDHRGNGYGKQAMQVLEDEARSLGMSKISLIVFGHNTTARSLYEKLGYEATSVAMSKTIPTSEAQ